MYSEQIIKVANSFKNKRMLKQNTIYNEIVKETIFLPEKSNIRQRFWHILNNTKEIPKCLDCNNKVNWLTKQSYSIYCSTKCVANSKSVRNKYKQTCLDKYGVENVSKSNIIKERKKETCILHYGKNCNLEVPEIKDRIKQTNLKKYGVEYTFQSKIVKDKIRQTCLERYGVDNPTKSKDISNKVKNNWKNKSIEELNLIKDKSKQTCLDRYDVDNPTKSKEITNKIKNNWKNKSIDELNLIKDKSKHTCLEKYGIENFNQKHLSKDAIDKLKNPEYLKDQHYNKKKSLKQISKELGLSSISGYFKKYNIPVLTRPISEAEKELLSFIRNIYNKEITTNSRSVITPLELDIYLPEDKLAIEFNGTYWHSNSQKPKEYHFNKAKVCYEKNINLIHVYEYEWDNFKSDIKYWLEKYVKNDLENVVTRDVYLKDIIDQNNLDLNLNWPINYDLLEKNNFKFIRTLEPEEIKIKIHSIYDAGRVLYKKN